MSGRGFNPRTIADGIPKNAQAAESQLQRIKLTESGDELIDQTAVSWSGEALTFDSAYAVRMIHDIVPNPFVGREIVGRLLAALRSRGFDEEMLGRFAALVTDELRRGLAKARDKQAETHFKEEVLAGRIQFAFAWTDETGECPFTWIPPNP